MHVDASIFRPFRTVQICADSNHRVELLTLGWTESSFSRVVTAPSSFDIHSFCKRTAKMKKFQLVGTFLDLLLHVKLFLSGNGPNLVGLGGSLQDECADALLVAVPVHDYKRVREP